MGRGRSKAKQTKVARELKYSNLDMDLDRLARELHGEIEIKNSEKSETTLNEENFPKS